MINLDDPETIGVLADLLQLQISRDRESVLATARARCATCGAHELKADPAAAAAASAVVNPFQAHLHQLKEARPHGRLV